MSLYDDMDAVKQKSEQVAGWSSGIKLLQSQMQLKKAVQSQPRNHSHRKSGATLAPVIDLKSKKEEDDPNNSKSGLSNFHALKDVRYTSQPQAAPTRDPDWNMVGEYDPMWPNDYEKVVKDLRDIREREKEKEDEEKRKKNREDREKRQRERFEGSGTGDERRKSGFSGFAGRNNSDEEDDEKPVAPRTGGAAIAPPPSLQEPSSDNRGGGGGNANLYQSGSSVAAKIMAKYGFKEGQGLGKSEQGIAMALQVEKTSKRGGRIIHEKEIMPPPVMSVDSPTSTSQVTPAKVEPTITEIMRSPTKVVLLRNMVGPGEVDEDLEPEVKDECNTKYGDVIRVIIYEVPNVHHEEAVRIFVEFNRIESAIKAVVDLNGRFFGGRQVKAGFYSWEKLNNLELLVGMD